MESTSIAGRGSGRLSPSRQFPSPSRRYVLTAPEMSRPKTFVPSTETTSGTLASPSPSVRDPLVARRDIRPSRLGVEMEVDRPEARRAFSLTPRQVDQSNLPARPDGDARHVAPGSPRSPPRCPRGRSTGPRPGSNSAWSSISNHHTLGGSKVGRGSRRIRWLRLTINHLRSRESDDQTGSLRKTLPSPGKGTFQVTSTGDDRSPRLLRPEIRSRPSISARGQTASVEPSVPGGEQDRP